MFLEGYGFDWVCLILLEPVSFLALEIQAEWSNMVNAFKLFQTFTPGTQKIDLILGKQIHFQEAIWFVQFRPDYLHQSNQRGQGIWVTCIIWELHWSLKKELWMKPSS